MSEEINNLNELYEKLTKELEEIREKKVELRKKEKIASTDYDKALSEEIKITSQKDDLLKKQNFLYKRTLNIVATVIGVLFPLGGIILLLFSIYLSALIVRNFNLNMYLKTIISIIGGFIPVGAVSYLTVHFGPSIFDKIVSKINTKIKNLNRFRLLPELEKQENIAKEKRISKYLEVQSINKEISKCTEDMRVRESFIQYLNEETMLKLNSTVLSNSDQNEKAKIRSITKSM